MKLLVEVSNKNNLCLDIVDGVILGLLDYAVETVCFFSLDEVIKIANNTDKEVFVKINKNLVNEDIEKVKDILLKLEGSKVKGIFFYDLALLQLKKELNLNISLVWNQTHMVNNTRTCDYYYDKGVKYALLGKEITLEEKEKIIKNSKIISMVEVVSRPSIGFSYRNLVTNYYKDLGITGNNKLIVREKVSDNLVEVKEDNNGTSFYLDKITNGTSIIKNLNEYGCSYIIIREYGIDCFKELVEDTKEYILDNCKNDSYIEKYKKLGDSTNFFFKKTIYKVKKNG